MRRGAIFIVAKDQRPHCAYNPPNKGDACSFALAVIALALVSLPAEASLASPGVRAGKFVESVTSIAPVPVKSGGTATPAVKKLGGTASPAVKKLSPKGGAACFRNCMHGVSGAGWGNFNPRFPTISEMIESRPQLHSREEGKKS
jgi:hypothetical protein